MVLTGRKPTNIFISSITASRPTWRVFSTLATASCWSRIAFEISEIMRRWARAMASITTSIDSRANPRAGMMCSTLARISVLWPSGTVRTFIFPICGNVARRATTFAMSAGFTRPEARHMSVSISNIGARESRDISETFRRTGVSSSPSRVDWGTNRIGSGRRSEFTSSTWPNWAKWLMSVVSRVKWVSLSWYLGDALYIF